VWNIRPTSVDSAQTIAAEGQRFLLRMTFELSVKSNSSVAPMLELNAEESECDKKATKLRSVTMSQHRLGLRASPRQQQGVGQESEVWSVDTEQSAQKLVDKTKRLLLMSQIGNEGAVSVFPSNDG
jgi:hypothetical protein